MDSFAKFLTRKRTSKKPKVSMRELARRTNVDPSYISRIEKGEHTPSRTVVINIAQALNEDVDEFLIHAGYIPNDKNYLKDSYTGDELSDLIPEEYRELFKEQNLGYVKFAKEMAKEKIDPKVLIELLEVSKKIRQDYEKDNKDK